MYWQLQSDMYFRMAGGWTGIAPFEFARMPVANYFYGGDRSARSGRSVEGLHRALRRPGRGRGSDTEANFESFKQTIDSLGVAESERERRVLIYKIPRDSFAAYAKLPAAQVEARAERAAIRRDSRGGRKVSRRRTRPLEALSAGTQAAGSPAARLARRSSARLYRLANRDRRPAAESASSSSARTRACDRCWNATARSRPRSIIPRRRDGRPIRLRALDFITPLLVTFDRAHLAAAAQRLHDSPPPERTTSFVAGVSSGL